MKAIVYHRFGSPDVLRLAEVATPAPGDREVLIAVRAAAANPADLHFLRGQPYVGRVAFGILGPRLKRAGFDVAGVVEAVGRKVNGLAPGDEVFGNCLGAFAEFATAPAFAVARKPANASFVEAASLPVVAFTALQGLRDRSRVRAGQRVLVNGASGGVGTLSVQIAKWLGAEVTAVCRTDAVELVRGLGADAVVDYTGEDFTRGGRRFDLVFDLVGNHPLAALRRVVVAGGLCLDACAATGRWVAPMDRALGALLAAPFVRPRTLPFIALPRQADLVATRELVETGMLRPVIDRCYALHDAADALRYLEAGHARGKIVLTV